MNIIEFQNVYKDFDGVVVLNDINYTFVKGSVTAIIGPSGSGKSTMLRCINQMETVSDGNILFKNVSVTDRKTNINIVRSKIGMVFQSFNLFENLSVIDNCTIGQRQVLRRSKEDSVEVALQFLNKVGLSEYANRKVTTLSGGQKQRVAIARTLSMNPEIILFDEPTSALDPEMVKEVLEVIKDISNEGYTLIVVTHEMDFAREVSDNVIFIDHGVVTEAGESDQVFSHPSTNRLQEFLTKF